MYVVIMYTTVFINQFIVHLFISLASHFAGPSCEFPLKFNHRWRNCTTWEIARSTWWGRPGFFACGTWSLRTQPGCKNWTSMENLQGFVFKQRGATQKLHGFSMLIIISPSIIDTRPGGPLLSRQPGLSLRAAALGVFRDDNFGWYGWEDGISSTYIYMYTYVCVRYGQNKDRLL